MMLERNLKVDHTTIYRWGITCAPELNKRCSPHLKPTNDSYKVDQSRKSCRNSIHMQPMRYPKADSIGCSHEAVL